MWKETPKELFKENLRSQAGTENPIHMVPPVGFKTSPKVGRRG